MPAALVDTGPLVALVVRSDPDHALVAEYMRGFRSRLLTTWPVLTEVCALLARRLSNNAALDFLTWMQRGAIDLDCAESSTFCDVLSMSERFADLPFDLADASVAEAAARLRISAVLTIDSDFDVYRDTNGRPLRNLLSPVAAQ